MSRELVLRAQAGDRDAYEQLARMAANRLFVVATRILRDTDAADDATQRALVSIWRDLPALRDPDRFDAWTYRLLVRACWAERRRRTWRRSSVVDVSEAIVVAPDEIGAVALREELSRAFDSLSLEHRTVVVLHHLVGLPLGEIAEILDIPYGTVGSRLHRALLLMRTAIEADARSVVREGQPA